MPGEDEKKKAWIRWRRRHRRPWGAAAQKRRIPQAAGHTFSACPREFPTQTARGRDLIWRS
eukprot:1327051-Pyramimonas_sp.AAC.1